MSRAAALACLGIWVAGHMVPSEHHDVLSSVGFVRYIGLGVLLDAASVHDHGDQLGKGLHDGRNILHRVGG